MKVLEIDIIKLLTSGDHLKWNAWLTRCLNYQDVESLIKTYNGLQINMAKLSKQKLNSDKVNLLFIRLTRSIENTLKQILRKKYPSPLDNSQAARSGEFNISELSKHKQIKRKRDEEFERYLRKNSY